MRHAATPLPELPGAVWRPATPDDLPAVVRWAAAVDEVENLEFAGGLDFWRWWLSQHDLAADTLLAVDPDGEILGATGSWSLITDLGAKAILWFDPRPDHLELEPVLLAWAEARGIEQIAHADVPERVVRVSVEEHRDRRRALVEAAGFRPVRTFVEMERSLDDPVPDIPVAPREVEIVTWQPEFDESVRLASNAAFSAHWGSLPFDEETFRSLVIDEDIIRRDLSFLAKVGDEVVAFCLASVDAEEDPGRLRLDRIGTVPSWQRRGLARLLMSRSLRAGVDAGLTSSGLGVDEANDHDATALYESLGYRATMRSIAYARDLDG